MYKCVPFFHINLFTFMPQSWVLILLIQKKKKKKSWMLILILLLHSGTENSVDCVDDSVVEIKCSNLADVTVEKSFDGSQDSESFIPLA